jgi:predicted nuclease of predicted toxin-antitoxin system
MKILLDHCIDWRLKRLLNGHDIYAARDMGWDELKNGKLLATAAANGFDVMLTVDQHIKGQQNLDRLPVAIIVLIARSNRTADLAPLVPFVAPLLVRIKKGALMEVNEIGAVVTIVPGT